jgi:hypothetical protein
MKRLFYFFVAAHFRGYFSKANWKAWVFDLLFSVLFAIYGSAAGLLLNTRTRHGIQQTRFFWYVDLFVTLAPALFTLSFSGLIKKFRLSHHYPLDKFQVALLDFVVAGLLKSSNLLIFIGLIFFIAVGNAIPVACIAGIGFFFMAGIVFRENLINAMAAGSIWAWVSVPLMAALLAFPYFNAGFTAGVLLGIGFVSMLIQMAVYFITYRQRVVDEAPTSVLSVKDPFLKLVLQNRLYRKTLITGLVFKTGALIYMTMLFRYKLKVTDTTIPELSFVLNAIYLPVLIFTYGFNNAWGYFRSLGLSLAIAGAPARDYLRYLRYLLRGPVLLDFFLGTATLWVTGFLKYQQVLFYVVFYFYALQIAFFSSFYRYARVSEGLSFRRFKGNTPILFNLLSFAGIIPLSVANDFSLRSFLLILTPVIAGSLFYFVNRQLGAYLQKKMKDRLIKNIQI